MGNRLGRRNSDDSDLTADPGTPEPSVSADLQEYSPWTLLRKPRTPSGHGQFVRQCPPMQYTIDDNEYWISLEKDSGYHNRELWRYSVSNDKYECFGICPKELSTFVHAFISRTNELYLFSSRGHVLDLDILKDSENINKWSNLADHWKFKDISLCEPSECVPDEYSLFSFGRFSGKGYYDLSAEQCIMLFQFDDSSKRLTICRLEPPEGIETTNYLTVGTIDCLWVQKMGLLFVGKFGIGTVWCRGFGNAMQNEETWSEWTEFSTDFLNDYLEENNMKAIATQCCVVMDTMLIIAIWQLFGKSAGIWCFDLVSKQWWKSAICQPGNDGYREQMHMLLSKDGYLHCVRHTSIRQHHKIHLSDIVPKEMDKLYRERLSPLIQGFCRQSQRIYELSSISLDISRLVLEFFPMF